MKLNRDAVVHDGFGTLLAYVRTGKKGVGQSIFVPPLKDSVPSRLSPPCSPPAAAPAAVRSWTSCGM
jgi:hypothetical protein